MNKFIVITTINKSTKAIKAFKSLSGWTTVLVGDKKTPDIKSNEDMIYLSVDTQKKLGYRIHDSLPYNHYSRKNIGYLYAIKNGADVIYDTDDDNILYSDLVIPEDTCSNLLVSKSKFINIYKHFNSTDLIWPRGLPLEYIKSYNNKVHNRKTKIGVWQAVVDKDPDVDAIYRFVLDKHVVFKGEPVVLKKGVHSPINSQSTFWYKHSFPYMYLPTSVSFRFTDILRGYIAQQLLWNDGYNIGYTFPVAYQDRNPHNLRSDFMQELEIYTSMEDIVDRIDNSNGLIDAYINLGGYTSEGYIPVENWLEDCL